MHNQATSLSHSLPISCLKKASEIFSNLAARNPGKKKHAVQSHRDPLNGNRYFRQLVDVNEFLIQLSQEAHSSVS